MTTNDPRFPNRPDHADFQRLSAIVCAQDARLDEVEPSEKTAAFNEAVAEAIDMDSLYYMATQRTARAGGGVDEAASWMDGFLVGAEYGRTIIISQDGETARRGQHE